MVVEDRRDLAVGPGEGVNAVGYGVDVVAGKHVARGFRLPLGNRVGVAGEIERQPRHVEFV